MTPQENQALQQLLSQLTQVKNFAKDAQAEAMIAQAVTQQPDAAYLLVQRAMLLEQALDAAKSRIDDLQQQLQAAPAATASGSFLDANAWGNTAKSQPAYPAELSVAGTPIPSNRYASADVNPARVAPATSGASGFLGGSGGSMLGTMAATAAGVAGGAFLFQGIGSLLGNHAPAHDAQAKAEPASATTDHATDNGLSPSALKELEPPAQSASSDSMADDFLASDSSFDDGSYEG